MKLLIPLVIVSLVAVAHAKRSAPAPVAPVTVGGVEYRVVADHLGCVDARDVKTGQTIWFRQIYVVRFDPDLERDVQDVHISSLKVKDNVLLVSSERGGEYQLDLKTLEVKTVKGVAVWTK